MARSRHLKVHIQVDPPSKFSTSLPQTTGVPISHVSQSPDEDGRVRGLASQPTHPPPSFYILFSGISLHSDCSTIFTKLLHRKIKKMYSSHQFSSIVIKPSRFSPLEAESLNNPSTRHPQGLSQVQVDANSCHSLPVLSQVPGAGVNSHATRTRPGPRISPRSSFLRQPRRGH